MWDPAAAAACFAAGVGAEVELGVGGHTDDKHGPTLDIRGRVRTLHDGTYQENERRHGGGRFFNQGPTAVVYAEGGLLVVSQFTLLGDCRNGRRPSFVSAAQPAEAERLYECFVSIVPGLGIKAECGRFRTHMNVALVNDGPVTLMLDSGKLF